MAEARPLDRDLSGLELALGAAIVVGHKVVKVLPNEVPILFGLGHWYKGPAGVIDSTVVGLLFSGLAE